jgi:hypothetical protein
MSNLRMPGNFNAGGEYQSRVRPRKIDLEAFTLGHVSTRSAPNALRAAACPLSASIPIGNGRSALFTIRTSRRSFLHTSQTQIASRLRQRSPTSRPRGGKHLHSCSPPMPSSYRHPIRKSGDRRCNASARLRRDPRRRPQSCWRSDPNLVSLGEASGEQRVYNVLSSISGSISRRLEALEGSWEQDDECPYCHDPFEIAQVKFGFNCISFMSACTNCRLVSISRTTERNRFWLLLTNVAQAMGVLTSKRRSAKLPIARSTSAGR